MRRQREGVVVKPRQFRQVAPTVTQMAFAIFFGLTMFGIVWTLISMFFSSVASINGYRIGR